MKRKVKIEALPKARTGQQVGYGLYNRLATMGGLSDTRPSNDLGVSRTIGSVAREEATIEAEGGETVFGDIAGIGIPQHYTITGPRHAQGGVPMALDGGEFIFSDYHNMKLKDPEALSYFGKTAKKGGKGKGFTYADIAKQYDINKYLKILKDPNSDDVDKRTAERMIENFNLKLGALGLHQEAQKGFEQGVPEVSRPYMEKMGITEEDLGIAPQEEMSPEMMMCGGKAPRKLKRQTGGPGAEMMGQEQMMDPSMMGQPGMEQQQDPMAQIMPMVEQMISQGADPNQIAAELLGMGVEPEMIMEVFIQMGMPEGEAQMAIEAAMSDMQQTEMMDPAMMEGQGMSPDMMPEMDPGMAMMQMGGMQQEPSLEEMIAQALQEGASPEEVLQALVQNGVPEQEAQQAVSSVAQQMQAPQQQMMQRGGLVKYQTAGQAPPSSKPTPPYKESEAIGDVGIERLNYFLKRVGEKELPKGSTKEQIEKAAGKVQAAMIEVNPDLVYDYMMNVSHQPNNKLKKLIPSGYDKTNAGVRKAIEDGKLTKEQVINAYKDNKWWYRALSTDRKHLSPEEYEKKMLESGVMQDDLKFFYDPESNTYVTYYTDENNEDVIVDTSDEKPDDVKEGKRPDIVDPNIAEYRDPVEADWTAPDIVNFRGAIADRLGAKTYYPHAQMYSPQFADPTFYDVSRTAAGIGEQSNIAGQALGQFTGPQALSARIASVQGQGAKAMADAIGNYDDRNVGIANQFASQDAQIANQAQLQNLDRMKRFYDEGTIAQQQRDNTRRQLDANVRQSFAQGWRNASDIALMNATSEQFNIDPLTGRVVFTGVQKPFDSEKASKTYEDLVQGWREKGLDPKDAIAAAKEQMRHSQGQPSFRTGGYVLGANVFPFMFY
jgi:SOS response regulatory protein OraA/RecX